MADQAADQALAYLASDVPVGPHLADQLILLLALAGGGSFRTLDPSQHTRTQMAVTEQSLGRKTAVSQEGPHTWGIAIT